MARLDWDRLRRVRPLDGADKRIDPDGGALWERPSAEAAGTPFGRRLRAGVIVRRRQERAKAEGAPVSVEDSPVSEPAEVRGPRSRQAGSITCHRCGARVSPRRLLRHTRSRCPRAKKQP